MKLQRLTYIFFFLSSFCLGQNCQWAKSCDGYSESNSVCTDKNGNVFITGYFVAPSITFGSYTLTCPGPGAVFLAKYDPNGNVLWAKGGYGDGNNIKSFSADTDQDGNIFAIGNFTGTSIMLDTYTLTNVGGIDSYLAKYDPNGNVLWAKSIGSADGFEFTLSVKTDLTNNVYVTGYSTSSVLTIGTNTFNNSSAMMYLVKYDAAGNVLWVKKGDGNAGGYAVTTDKAKNVFITGSFGNPTMTIDTQTLTNVDNNSFFYIAKFDSTGSLLWMKNESCGYGYGLSTNFAGDLFVTGGTGGTPTPTSSVGSYTFANKDVFISKYDSNGNVVWAKGIGSGSDYAYAVSTDVSNIYATGRFNSPLVFGTNTLTVPAGYVNPIYFARFDFNGNFVSATALDVGNGSNNHQNWICADAFSNVYVTGFFQTNPFNTGCGALAPTGNRSGFLAKYYFSDVGLKENLEKSSFQLFPNPVSELLYLRFPENEFEKGEIINSVGQLVKAIDLTSIKDKEISVRGLKEGIYVLNLSGANSQTVSKRFVIAR
jgi:hypothetical protein